MTNYTPEEIRQVERDDDLLCRILKLTKDQGLVFPDDIEIEGYSEREIMRHVQILSENGYVNYPNDRQANVLGVPMAAIQWNETARESYETLCAPLHNRIEQWTISKLDDAAPSLITGILAFIAGYIVRGCGL